MDGRVKRIIPKRSTGGLIMPDRQTSCPECGASIDVFNNKDGDIFPCSDCGESLELIKNTGKEPELIYNY